MNAITESILKEAADAFAFDRTTGEISRYGEGHINDTFVVWASDKCKRYIMQRINTDTFKNPKELMETSATLPASCARSFWRMAATRSVRR